MLIKYVCEEHIDEAMDHLINEYETFPIIEKNENQKCEYCQKQSIYEVKDT